jgi:hypothetical protein
MRAALPAEVNTSPRFCNPKYSTTPVRPNNTKVGSTASLIRNP